MSNLAKTAENSSSEEEEEDSGSESEEEQQPRIAKGKVEVKAREVEPDEDEESDEEESDTDNDAHQYKTVRREGNSADVKAEVVNNPPGKRGRDAEGREIAGEEPVSKKSKDVRADKPRANAVKAGSPPPKLAGKGNKAPAKAKPERPKSVAAPKDDSSKAPAASRKRKAASPPANGAAKELSQKAEVTEKSSPVKQKTVPFSWTNSMETLLSTILLNDKKKGTVIPVAVRDPYWVKLIKDLTAEGGTVSANQVSDKVRRMKGKYNMMKAKDADIRWKNENEERLYKLWDCIWGSGNHVASQGVQDEEDDDESSEEEEAATPAVKHTIPAPVPSRKEESSDTEEDEEEDDDHGEPATKKPMASQDGSSKGNAAFTPAAPVVSPFVSKPRLEFTPLLPREDKKKVSRKGEDGAIAGRSGGDLSGEEEVREEQTAAADEVLSTLKRDSLAVLQEVRSSCMEAVSDIRKQSMSVLKDINSRLGGIAPTPGIWRLSGKGMPSLSGGSMEEFLSSNGLSGFNGADNPATAQLRSHWRQLRVEEIDLLEKRMQLMLKQMRLAKEELNGQDN